MPPKPAASSEEQGVRLDSLSFPELYQLRERINADIQRLSEGMAQLQGFMATINGSSKAISQLQTAKQGQQILLPLTSSLYVPGELASTENVLVDVGTGYYVEMTPEDGTKFCERKAKKLQENLTVVATNLREKQGMLMQVQQTIADKQATQGASR